MKKLVVLKLDGDLEVGVRVTLEIGEEGERPYIEVNGQLPKATELVTTIDQWQSAYRSVGKSSRLEAKKIVYGGSITQWREDCHKSAAELRKHLNKWLLSESFRPIREKWLQQLSSSDEVRVLIRTQGVLLRKIPWHLWDLVEDYPKAEVAYCAPESEQPASLKTPTYRDKVRILAILGNSTRIDVHKDRQLLENLPDAATTFLVEPQRQDINDHLWNQPWDILFFAGHSKTEANSGRIYINQTDSLTIAELRYGLTNAVANGLQLAIFNSCDGLGLALELEQLHMGQMIVMREPVPDEVAQAFLTYFLAEFAKGKSFYLAEREARLKLHGLEDKFPCASWLPAIFQNPAAVPPFWQDLGRRPTELCPYRGLFAFREEDAPFFYGRDAFTQMLVEAVQQQSLVAVIGPSGSGKSSVVFAGLIPRLRQVELRHAVALHMVTFRPGDRPFRNLAAKLVPLLETQMSETEQLVEINKLATALRQGDLRLRDVVTRILEKNSGDRLLLVADQFEELYTLCRDARERLLFLDNLLEAVNHTPNFTLVLTLRADFLGQALSYRPFGDALQYADLKLSPMNREELQAAVEQPAAMLGVTIESGLTERILDAVSTQPGDLPLLEFALNQLWAKQRDAQLTHAAYEEIGGVEAALSRYAEEAYGRLNEEEKERARRIFIQLVRPGEGTEDTRRLATRTEVGEENWDLVTRLADARLVVSSRDEALGEETVEIVHEALIGGWERLRSWIELDRSFRTWQERLRASLRQWEASGRDEGALLRGVPLAEAESWLQSRPVELSPAERVFIQLSMELRDRERKQQERRRRRTILGLVGLVVVSIFAVGAFWRWQRAEISRTNAELNDLSTTSEVLFTSNQKFEALIESIRTGRRLKQAFGVNADTRMRVVLALQQAVYGVRERNRLQGHEYSVNSVSFSPDGKTIASASDDSTVKLWSYNGTLLRTLSGHNRVVNSVSFSPDGKTIASANDDSTVNLWNYNGTLLRTLRGHNRVVNSVSFSPNGKTIASVSDDGTIKLWRPDGSMLKTWSGHGGKGVKSVSFSPNGKMLASAGNDKTIKLWRLDGTLFKTLSGHTADIKNVSFSPDGQALASASADKTVKLWRLDGTLLETLQGHTAGVNSVSFSPDGQTLASASADKTVKLWRLDGTLLETLQGHTAGANSVSFRSDGQTLASASMDNAVKLWSLNSRGLETLKGHSGKVSSISFSPDGKLIASVGVDKTVTLWSRNGRLRKLSDNNLEVNSVSFSPDGKMIAMASDEKIPERGLKGSLSVTHFVVKLKSLDGTVLNTLKEHPGQVTNVSFSPDGQIIASASIDNNIRLWRRNGTLLKTLPGNSDDHFTNVSFSPDGKMIAAARNNKIIVKFFWSFDGKRLQIFEGHTDNVTSISFSPDSKTIASTSLDHTVKLWSLDGKWFPTLKGHSAKVNSVSFSPNGQMLASVSDDHTVKLWSLDGRLLKTLQGHQERVLGVSFSPDGKTLISASSDDTAILWNLDLDVLLRQGCNWVHDYVKTNYNLSQEDRQLCDGRWY